MKGLHTLRILLFMLHMLLIFPFLTPAEDVQHSTSLRIEGAYYLDDNKGYGVVDGGFAPISYTPEPLPGSYVPIGNDEGRDLGTGWGAAEIQALLTHTIKVPFLVGTGALSSGNNVTFAITGALTPVSTRLELRAVLTPIAFFNLFVGGMLGTGWDIGPFNGMGLNADGSGVPESASFRGVVLESWIGGTIQFDLAALVPGDWTHVVTLISPKLQYSAFSGADKGEAWMWEADEGENFNGFRFYGSYFLGYQMPAVLNTVGILMETSQNLGYVKDLSTMDSGGWGSEYVMITVGPVFNFTLSESSSLAVLLQFRRKRLYDETSVFYNYFRNRHAVGTYWDFYRIAFSLDLKL